ncbi:secreted trypsin-like serine protease [Kitasatospora sp. MAA4]|uniref:serine protease n=1 Tax=Kitasatospora sp. MAA4 TaxID=3035093 RepID=UPI00247673F1|nr:serine protease [Kitasatospora sp. MAA4]MDH6131430.1 secreted trypsin-like serine protease [Kitasatospora sp. MAA4]
MIKHRAVQIAVAISALLFTLVAAPPAGAIVSGSASAQGQFPYLVSLRISGSFGTSHICGGSILDADTILTAAHCVDGRAASAMTVAYGSADRTGGTSVAIAKIIMNPSYNPSTIDSDIAILKLASPILLDGTTAAPIALPATGSEPTGPVQAAGWGRTAWQNESIPQQQQYVDLPVVDRSTCEAQYKDINPLTKTMVCAGGTGTGVCNGDSGGPLVQNQGGVPVEVGVVSWGVKCGELNYPSVFANTAEAGLRSWIDTARGSTALPAAQRRAAAPQAPLVGSDHGCPFDSVCLYTTTDDYENNQPVVTDSQAMLNDGGLLTVPAGSYAEVVNNTGVAPEYSSQGTVALGLLGLCVYVPEDTEASGTDTRIGALGVNTIVVAPTQSAVDSLTIPCPAN